MSAEEKRLLDLAGSISDGELLDWKELEETASCDDDRALLHSLKVVAGVSRVQRGGDGLPPGSYGRLDILERLGEGAYGAVYRAWDKQLEREVAIKILHPRDDVDLLLAEGRRLASVKHPNIVTIYAAEKIDGRPAIRMECVHGRTLAEIVREHGPIACDEIIAIGAALCGALTAIHAEGLLHQDVKAQNVMRERGGRIVLMDFGPGGATPLYLAPEVLRGGAPSARSDLYSLGVLLYYAATGSFPVVGTTRENLEEAHARGRVRPLRDARPDFPEPVARVIDRALAPDPGARFESAARMKAALEEASRAGEDREAAGLETSASATATDARAGRRARRPLALAALILVAIALAAAALWILPSRRGRTSRVAGILSSATTGGAISPKDGGASANGAPGERDLGAYTIEARLHRGWREREPLADGARLAIGDSISLTLRASERVHVYVIDEDDRGEAYLLFPLSGMSPANPLPPDATHVLPGTRGGQRFYWQVTSAGGQEHLVLLASRERLVGFEAEMLAVERPLEGRAPAYPRLSGRAKERLRGLGGLAAEGERVPAPAERGSLFDLAQKLTTGPERVNGIWIRRIDLENPAR